MTKVHASTPSGIDLAAKLAIFSEPWQPRVVGQFNGHDLMVAKLKGELTGTRTTTPTTSSWC